MKRALQCAFVLLQWVFAAGISAQVIRDNDPALTGIDVVEHLGDHVPLDVRFTDETGRETNLAEYFRQDHPVLLVLAYYNCPMLCTLVLNGIAEGVKGLDWTPGREFVMLTVSIDSSETPALASAKKDTYVKYLAKPGAESGWHFLTGREDQIRTLADAVGFKYYYVTERREFAHPAVVFLLTDDGRLSRYLYGLKFESRDVKLGLLEASEGKIGNTLDRLLLYCFHYDPDAKGYVLFAQNIMKIGGGLTVLVLVAFLFILWRRDARDDSPNKANAV